MPATRRSTGRSSNQPTLLSFNSRSARVTKPTAAAAAVKDGLSSVKKPLSPAASSTSTKKEPAAATTADRPSTPPEPAPAADGEVSSMPVRLSPLRRKKEQPQPRSSPVRRTKRPASAASPSSREVRAQSISDAQIKQYWQAEEARRLAPRVHQKSLSVHEKILRHFDISSQYGPCIGIPRLARWRRADGLGLEPPVEVLAVLLREEAGAAGQLAYIDELAGAKDRGAHS